MLQCMVNSDICVFPLYESPKPALPTYHGRHTVNRHLVNTVPIQSVFLKEATDYVEHVHSFSRGGKIFTQQKLFLHIRVVIERNE